MKKIEIKIFRKLKYRNFCKYFLVIGSMEIFLEVFSSIWKYGNFFRSFF